MSFLKTVVTPAGTQAVYDVGLAGHHLGEVGDTIDDVLASLPDIVKSGGDVAASILRTVNYTPPPVPVSTYTGMGMVGGLSGTTLLLVGGGLLAFMMMRKRR